MGALLVKEGTIVKRNDTGALVRIIDVQPVGLDLFYRCEDVETGRLSLISAHDLRPAPRSEHA